MKLSDIKGIGRKKEELLNSLGINTVYDLANYFPRKYEDRSKKVLIEDAFDGIKNYFELMVFEETKIYYYGSKNFLVRLKATDGKNIINIVWYNDKFSSRYLVKNTWYKFFGLYNKSKNSIVNPIISQLNDSKIGGIYPIYSIKKGISNKDIINFKDNLFDNYYEQEYLREDIIEKYNIFEINTMLRVFSKPDNFSDLMKAKFTYSVRELLIEKYANKLFKKFLELNFIKFDRVDKLPLYSAIGFELTKSQKEALIDIENDMYSSRRMNRIVIGDVGSGKTILGIISAYIAIINGYQVAFMAPTELLAKQHYSNFKDLFNKLNISVEILFGSMREAEKTKIRNSLKNGSIDIIFGTHSLFQDSIIFKNLGLAILDEQQRFGVFQRKKLSDKGYCPDILLLTATPIPRTMALSLYNQLDVSFIDSNDRNRGNIESYLVNIYKEKRVINFAIKQVKEGRQVYIIASRVEEDEDFESVEKLYKKISKYVQKNARVDFLHGKMSTDEKLKKQMDFQNHFTDILISTTIVEVGIDVKNANLIIIYDAEHFGLSQLHQLRGRVGRGEHKSYCIFISNSKKFSEKLKFIEKNNDGFEIAKKDLELRGSGQIFGENQSGFENKISDILFNEKALNVVNDILENISDFKFNDNFNKIVEKRLLNYQKIIMN